MYEPKSVEYVDQFICVKHNNPIAVVSFEEGVKIQDQLLCGQCLSEATKISPTQLPWKIVKNMIQEQQQKRLSHYEALLEPMLDNIADFESTIDQIRQRVACIDQIANTTSIWKKQITSLRNNEYKYSIFKELEIIASKDKFNEASSLEEQQIGKMKQYLKQFINQLWKQFQEFSPSKELIKLQEIIQKVDISIEQSLICRNHFIHLLQGEDSKISAITCLCPKHKTPITMINLNKGIKKENRTICVHCDISNVISTFRFEERWKKYQESLQTLRNDNLNKLQLDVAETKQQITQMKSQLHKDFNQIEGFLYTQIKNRIELISKSNIKGNYNNNLEQLQQTAHELSLNENNNELIKNSEFDRMYSEQNQQLILQLKKLSKQFNGAIENLIKITESKLIESQKNVQGKQIDDINEGITKQQQNQLSIPQPISYKLVQEVSQEENCYTIAFNNKGTIMAAAYGFQIKIWEFENGTLKSTPILLSEHTDFVKCLVFSKQCNWFASGSYDNTSIGWKQTSKNNWVCSQPAAQHTNSVCCILLNRNENQVLTSSYDKSIKVWTVDCLNNTFKYNYSLDRHTNCVYCISLNESETSLVSSSTDKSIIIWGKGQLNIWEFKYYITKSLDDFGYRISFIKDNMIAWQPYTQGITHIFELENGIFQERPNLQIPLNQVGEDGFFFFPSIYNKKRKILIQKHNKYVYIIRQQHDGKFKVESQPINCNHHYNFGGLTNNGQYLVIYNEGTKQFRVYRINYE